MKDQKTREELKKLLISASELNVAISNVLSNTGGSMGDVKEEVVVVAAAEGSVVEGAVVTEVVVAAAPEVVVEPVVVVEAVAAVEVAPVVVVEAVAAVEEKKDEAVVEATVAAVVEEVVVVAATASADVCSVCGGPMVAKSNASAPDLADLLTKTISAEDVKTLGLDEAQASLVLEKNFIDLVKAIASLTQEVTQYRAQANAAESTRVAEARVSELKELGVSLDLSEGSADRERITGMDEQVFTAYRDGVRDLSKTTAAAPVVEKELTIEQARASLNDIAVEVKLVKKSSASLFSQI